MNIDDDHRCIFYSAVILTDAAAVDAAVVLNVEQDSMYQDDICVHGSRDAVVQAVLTMLIAGMLVGSLTNEIEDIEVDLSGMVLVKIILPQYILQREVLPASIDMINECDSASCML